MTPDYFEMAREGTLPPGFKDWDLAGRTGWTVAHVAAAFDHLTAGFDRWELATKAGWTVAHEAAEFGHLPEGCSRWDLADQDGRTVREVYGDDA